MSADLAHWLTEHRPTLMPRWAAAIGTPMGAFALVADAPSNGHLEPGDTTTAVSAVLTLDQIYDGIIAVAAGDSAPLDALFHETSRNNAEVGISDFLRMASQLRRIVHDLVRNSARSLDEAFAYIEAIDHLLELTTNAITRAWTEHNAELISEREFIAESLDAASASADRRALQLKALNDISQRLSASLEEEQILDLVVSNLFRLTEVAHIAVWQLTTDDGPLALRATKTYGAETCPVVGMSIALDHVTDLVARAFQTRRVQYEGDNAIPGQGEWLQPDCGVLALPMLINEQVIGVVGLQDPEPVQQLRFQQDLFQGVISQAVIALQNAQLYAEVRSLNAALEERVRERTRELEEEKERLATIHEISTEVSKVLDLDTLLHTSLEALARITHAEHASIMLVEEENSNLMVTRAVLGVPRSDNYTRFAFGTGIAGWVAQNRRALLVEDVNNDPRWISIPGGSLRKREGSMLATPLTFQGNVLGVLSLSHREAGFFHEGHLRLVNASAGAIATGINNANLYTMILAEAERRTELLDRMRKEASQVNAILQSLSDGVIVCDTQGSVLLPNPAAARIFQRGVEELVVWNLHDLLNRYLGPRTAEMPLNELLQRPLRPNNQPRIYDTTIKVGQKVVSLTLGPVIAENSELLGALLVLRDITREVEADRLKVEFIGTMSHELRTPMTAIKGFTQLLAMGGLGPLNDTQREFVSTIYQNTERMIALINDVLDITKIESGSVDLEMRSLHLAEALSGVMAELQGLIAERKHDLVITIPPGLPLIRADAHRFHQILYNLASNAVKYTPRQGKIIIEAREAVLGDLSPVVRDALASDRRYVLVEVRDTGVGIDEQELARIFDRFYRTENPLKIEAGGTGLGLSLVKPLVELMGGRIWVDSSIGQGSCFGFVLPAA
jgi:PAS domain S-box-containing protein